MTTNETKDFTNRIAKIITVVFHPLLMPVYGMAIIFSAPTLLGYLPFNLKKILLLILLVNNVLLPLSLLPFFIQRKIISSWSLPEKKRPQHTTYYYNYSLLFNLVHSIPVPDPRLFENIHFRCSVSVVDCYRCKFLVENLASFCWSRGNNRTCPHSFTKNADAA